MRNLIRTLLVLPTFSALAAAQALPIAGREQVVTQLSGAVMSGVLKRRTPLDFWTADGNGATEDKIVMYHEGLPVTSSPWLHDANNMVYGWPSDLQRINGVIYGIESGRRLLYTVDVQTGLCTPIGSPSTTYGNVYCLAYDATNDRLFAVDLLKKQLLSYNRFTGVITKVGIQTLTTYKFIRSLAYRESDGFLYAVDQGLDKLIRIDPISGFPTVVRQMPVDPMSRIEELEFDGDDLYASNGLLNLQGDLIGCQLQKVDLAPNGPIKNLGSIIPDCSPHSLIINSLPEEFVWSQDQGPGTVTFADPESLTSSVSFSMPGKYVLRLTAFTKTGPVSDTVAIQVR